ncbi:MAG TPA: hypothetical protein GX509_03840 [Firmicutes bacterium]|nr:hypothetical protein [Bacillota bacterium]HHY97856.1 hypothetical protein [Bacillota bacterium]
MLPVRKRIAPDGSILIGEALRIAKIQPGDLVEIVPAIDKITIKPVAPQRAKDIVRAVAGKWKDRRDLVEDLSRVREDEDDRPGTSLE